MPKFNPPTAKSRKSSGENAKMGKSMLMYGTPKSGKTFAIGKLSKKFKLLYFDLESSRETFYSDINAEHFNLDNIYIQPVFDTTTKPFAQQIFTQFFAGQTITLCPSHGLPTCPVCKAAKLPSNSYNISDIPEDFIVVIDSGSQLNVSIQSKVYANVGTDNLHKDSKATFNHWRSINQIWDDIGTVCQNAGNIPVKLIMTFHQAKEEDLGIFPTVSTSNYGASFSKYFSHVVRTKTDNRRYSMSVSSIDDKGVAGNRAGIKKIASDADWFALWGVK